MFHHRSSSFGPSVTAIQQHLGAVEKELEKLGRIAGRRTSVAASAASDQIGDAISTIMSDMIERLRQSGQAAGDRAAQLGSRALSLGGRYGSNALEMCIRDRSTARPILRWPTTRTTVSSCGGVRRKRATRRRPANGMRWRRSARR